MPIQNEKVREHMLLKAMLADAYFPKHLVEKGQDLLRQLAERIERDAPEGEAVYKLTETTAEAFNALQKEFWEADSDIETGAREAIAADVAFILEAYGYDVDIEKAIGNRDW
jgi:alkylhydroperoxidase family enzyme